VDFAEYFEANNAILKRKVQNLRNAELRAIYSGPHCTSGRIQHDKYIGIMHTNDIMHTNTQI